MHQHNGEEEPYIPPTLCSVEKKTGIRRQALLCMNGRIREKYFNHRFTYFSAIKVTIDLQDSLVKWKSKKNKPGG